MNGSRIWLDLSALFSCSRKQSCIHIDHEKYRTVKDVQDHISCLFDLKGAIHILNDGWLLPASESSLLFRDNDVVSVVPEEVPKRCPLKDDPVVPKCKEINDVFQAPSKFLAPANSDAPHKPVVINGNGPAVLKENAATTLKNSLKNPFANVQVPLIKEDINSDGEKPSEKIAAVTNTSKHPNSQEDDAASSEIGSEGKKRKRIRRRKKKSRTDIDVDQAPAETKQSRYHSNKLFQSISYTLSMAKSNNTALANNTSAANTSSVVKDSTIVNEKRKHIYFDEPEEKESHERTSNEEASGERVPKTQIIHDLDSQLLQMNSSPARGEIAQGLSKLLSLENQKSPVVFGRKKAENPNITESGAKALVPEQKILKLTPLNEIPVKETLIKFKVLKMNNYSPVMSETITARVISPDIPNKQIYVEIKEGLCELQTEKGKFSLDSDDTLNDDVPLGEYLYLDWHDLIEPQAVEYC